MAGRGTNPDQDVSVYLTEEDRAQFRERVSVAQKQFVAQTEKGKISKATEHQPSKVEMAIYERRLAAINEQIRFVESLGDSFKSIPAAELDGQISLLMQMLVETRHLKKGSSAEALTSSALEKIISARKDEASLLKQKLVLVKDQLIALQKAELPTDRIEERKEIRLEVVTIKEEAFKRQDIRVEAVVEDHRVAERVKTVDVLAETRKQQAQPQEIIVNVKKDLIKEKELRQLEDVKTFAKVITKEKLTPIVQEIPKPLIVEVPTPITRTQIESVEEEVIVPERIETTKPATRQRLVEKLVVKEGVTVQLKRQQLTEEYNMVTKETPGDEVMEVKKERKVQEMPVDSFRFLEKVVEVPKEVQVDRLVERVKKQEKQVQVETPLINFEYTPVEVEVIQERIVHVPKTVHVERPVGEVKVEEIDVLVCKAVPSVKEVKVDKIKYIEKPVDVNVERPKYTDRIKPIDVPVIKVKEVEFPVVLHCQQEEVKLVENEVIVPVDRVVYRDEIVAVEHEKAIYNDKQLKVEVPRLVEAPKDTEVECSTTIEQIVYEEKAVEVPVDRIVYTEGEVEEVAVERLVVQENVVQVPKERRVVNRLRERAVPVEVITDHVRETVVRKENEVCVCAERVVYKDRNITVPVGLTIETTTRRPVPVPNYIEVPVERVVRRDKGVPVSVDKLVHKDRQMEIEVARVIEVPRPYEKIVQVPVEKVVFHDRTVEVPVQKIEPRVNEVHVRVENTIYEDKPVERGNRILTEKYQVELTTTIEQPVPWENRVEVPVERVRYEDREVKVPVNRLEGVRETEVPVEVERIVYEDNYVEVPVEVVKYVDREVYVEVDRPVYEDRVVEVPVEQITFEDHVVEVPVEKLIFKGVPQVVELTRTVERAVADEIVKKVEVRHNTIREKDVEVPVDTIVVNEIVHNVPVQTIVEANVVEVPQPIETIQEVIVYKEKVTEAEVQKVLPNYVDVNIAINKLALKTNYVSVREKHLVDKVTWQPELVERPIHVQVDQVHYKENYIDVPVERAVIVQRDWEVPVMRKEDRLTQKPQLQEVAVDVEVQSRVRVVEEAPEVHVHKAVYQDRTVDIPVHTIKENLVVFDRPVTVPYYTAKYVEKDVEVPVEKKAVYTDKIRHIPVERVVYRDREVNVELETMEQVLVPEEVTKEVPIVKTIFKDKEVEVTVEEATVDESEVIHIPVEKLKIEERQVLFLRDELKPQIVEIKVPVEKMVTEDKLVVREVSVNKVKKQNNPVEVPQYNVIQVDVERIVEIPCQVPEPVVVERVKEVQSGERIRANPVEHKVEVPVEVPTAVPVKVGKHLLLENQSIVEREIHERHEVPIKVPEPKNVDREIKVQRSVEQLKVIGKPREMSLVVQRPRVEKRPRVVEQVRSTQSQINVPVVEDSPKELVVEVPAMHSRETSKTVELKTWVQHTILSEEPKTVFKDRVVHLQKEVGREVEQLVDLPVEVEFYSGVNEEELVNRLEKMHQVQAALELRAVGETRILEQKLLEAQARTDALRKASGQTTPSTVPVIREVVRDVEVIREVPEYTEAAPTFVGEHESKIAELAAALETARRETAAVEASRSEAMAAALRARHLLERLAARERALQRHIAEGVLEEFAAEREPMVEVKEKTTNLQEEQIQIVPYVQPMQQLLQVNTTLFSSQGLYSSQNLATPSVYSTAPASAASGVLYASGSYGSVSGTAPGLLYSTQSGVATSSVASTPVPALPPTDGYSYGYPLSGGARPVI